MTCDGCHGERPRRRETSANYQGNCDCWTWTTRHEEQHGAGSKCPEWPIPDTFLPTFWCSLKCVVPKTLSLWSTWGYLPHKRTTQLCNLLIHKHFLDHIVSVCMVLCGPSSTDSVFVEVSFGMLMFLHDIGVAWPIGSGMGPHSVWSKFDISWHRFRSMKHWQP